MAERIQNSFYLLKETYTFFNEKTQKFTEETIDFKFLNKHFKAKGYKEQNVLDSLSDKYEIKLYYKKNPTTPSWKDFIKSVVQENEDILRENKSYSESYLLILKNGLTNRYFVTTGGYGHIFVQGLATTDFGLNILSRLIKAEDKALKSTKERSLTGGVQGAVKIFRNDYNFYENESFGNVYNELNATIDKKQLIEIFGFTQEDISTSSFCVAKDSFSLRKSVSFNELLMIIERCEDLLLKPAIVEINTVEKIPKQSKTLISKLYDNLFSQIYCNYLEIGKSFSVEISHKEFDKYYYSQVTIFNVVIKRKRFSFSFDGPIREIQTLLNKIRKIDNNLSKEEFKTILKNSTIQAYEENGILLTEDYLKNHFCSEVMLDKQSYFLIEKDWYKIKERFLETINDQASYFIKNNRYEGQSLKKWESSYSCENDYNMSYLGEKSFLVFDKFTPQNIEACDIMTWDEKNIYFIHIKQGFDNSMRDLCHQVFISARKINEDIKNNYPFLASLYDLVKNNRGKSTYHKKARGQLTQLTQERFLEKFNNRNIIFVLAVLDTAKSKRELEKDINQFDSNIAKFSLSELAKNMRNLDAKFQIVQLFS